MNEKSKILVVEDDPIFAIRMRSVLAELCLENIELVTSGEEAIKIIEHNRPDIIISDIILDGKKTGIDVAEVALFEHIPIVLMTISKDFNTYDEAVSKGDLAYLVKPFHALTLKSAIDLLLISNRLGDNKAERLYVRGNHNEKLRLGYDDIVWIEVDRNYCTIQTTHSKYVIKQSLLCTMKKMNDVRFVRIHNRYVVNLHHIKSISTDTVRTMSGDIPLGRTYKKDLEGRMLLIK